MVQIQRLRFSGKNNEREEIDVRRRFTESESMAISHVFAPQRLTKRQFHQHSFPFRPLRFLLPRNVSNFIETCFFFSWYGPV